MSSTTTHSTGRPWARAGHSAIAVAVCLIVVPVAGAATSVARAAPTTVTSSSRGAPSESGDRAFCGILWGSLAKKSNPSFTGAVSGVRSGQHECYERVVFDVGVGAGQLGYNVRYVSVVTSPTTGLPVDVSGGATLQVTINAPATLRVPPSGTINYTGWRTLRQLKWVTSFEGQTDFGLGVRARLPMRVFTLPGASGGQRLVIDVAHRW